MRVERRCVEVGNLPVHYQVAGAGKPVVLVHGLAGSARWWEHNVRPLAERFHVHVVDLIHFGAGHKRPPFALAEAAGHLVRWADHLGLGRLNLVGHSMGGLIAAELAADFPGRVNRLVLVDAAALPFHRGDIRTARDLILTLLRLPLGFLPVLFLDAYRAGLPTIWRAGREVMTTDIAAKILHIQAPTLVIWGERDALLPLAIGEQLRQRLQNARLVVLRGAGHNPMWDRPDEFNRVVGDFLGQENGVRET